MTTSDTRSDKTARAPRVSRLAAVDREWLLTGNLRPVVWMLALPVLGEQFLSFCVGTTDLFLAGHLPEGVSQSATTSVGLAAYVGWLASLAFTLIAAGTTAMVARARGAQDVDLANRVANRSLTMSIVMGLGVMVALFLAAPLLAGLLGLTGATRDMAVRYLRLDAIGLVFMSIGYIGSAALRGCGNMRLPMLMLGTVSILNIIVSCSLVYGWGPITPWGVDGIVVGTVIARMIGGLLIVGVLARGVSGLKLHSSELRMRGETSRRVLAIGIPAGIDGIVMWGGHFVFLRIISELGETELATHMVGIRLEAITYLPAVAWGAAAATLIGQSLGAGDPERAKHAGQEAVRQCGLLGLFITAGFLLGAGPLLRLMNNSPGVWEVGVPAIRLMALFQIPLIASIIYVAGLRGAGDTRYPMLMTMFSTFVVRLPLAWICGVVLDGGLFGAWIGMCADMLVRGVLAAWRFHSGLWVTTRV